MPRHICLVDHCTRWYGHVNVDPHNPEDVRLGIQLLEIALKNARASLWHALEEQEVLWDNPGLRHFRDQIHYGLAETINGANYAISEHEKVLDALRTTLATLEKG